MYEKICAFCGDQTLDLTEYTSKVEAVITDLVENHGYNAFFSGHANDFDIMCESIVKRLKNKYPNLHLYGVLANGGEFDEVINLKLKLICEYEPEIMAKNRWMAERSDLTLCCVDRNYGYAWRMKQYAEKLGREIINPVKEMQTMQ